MKVRFIIDIIYKFIIRPYVSYLWLLDGIFKIILA